MNSNYYGYNHPYDRNHKFLFLSVGPRSSKTWEKNEKKFLQKTEDDSYMMMVKWSRNLETIKELNNHWQNIRLREKFVVSFHQTRWTGITTNFSLNPIGLKIRKFILILNNTRKENANVRWRFVVVIAMIVVGIGSMNRKLNLLNRIVYFKSVLFTYFHWSLSVLVFFQFKNNLISWRFF